jgi:MFS family permease
VVGAAAGQGAGRGDDLALTTRSTPTGGRLGPEFTKLWTASTVSNLGDGITVVAGPLLAASLTRNPLLVAALTFAQRLPWLLLSLPSGALVDRLDRRRVMVAADLFRASVIGLLGVAILLDGASIALLCTTFFLLGVAETLFDNAAVSILPTMVPRASLTKANGRLLGAQIVTNDLAAPPLGGLLFATAAAVPFLLNAGWSVLALFGFHAMIWNVVSVSLRQELIPARLLGRVNSAYAVFSYGGASLGALLGGVLAGRFGLTAPFWCGFVAVTILALAAWPTLSSGRVRAARERAAADG